MTDSDNRDWRSRLIETRPTVLMIAFGLAIILGLIDLALGDTRILPVFILAVLGLAQAVIVKYWRERQLRRFAANVLPTLLLGALGVLIFVTGIIKLADGRIGVAIGSFVAFAVDTLLIAWLHQLRRRAQVRPPD